MGKRYVHPVAVSPPEPDTAPAVELPLSTVDETPSLVPPWLDDRVRVLVWVLVAAPSEVVEPRRIEVPWSMMELRPGMSVSVSRPPGS